MQLTTTGLKYLVISRRDQEVVAYIINTSARVSLLAVGSGSPIHVGDGLRRRLGPR